jgi:hypothetical protein
VTPAEQFIREYSASIGLSPDIVMQVVMSEGGASSLENLTRQSLIGGAGTAAQEQSYGPLQLNINGGVGQRALEAGIDPRDPAQAFQALKFGLDVMKKEGLGQWHGWKGDPWAANTGAGTGAEVALPVSSDVYRLRESSVGSARDDSPHSGQPIGSKLPGSPYDLPKAPAVTVDAGYGGPGEGASHFGGTGLGTPAAPPVKITPPYRNPLAGVGAAVGKLGARGQGGTQIGNVPNPPSMMLPPIASVDPQAQAGQRQQLIAALMALNSGKLFPSAGGGGQIG